MLQRAPDKIISSKLRRRRKLKRERNRRWRKHLAAGEVVVPTVVGASALDLLIRLHWLCECDAHDRNHIGAAISRLLNASGE
jgi:hypothetical protein